MEISLSLLFIFVIVHSVNSLSHSTQSPSMSQTPTTIGFIGCGTIACAIATGLLTQTEHTISKIYVSRRSESKSKALAAKFSEKVLICDDSQEIVDCCDAVFLCVLPQQEEEVLKRLNIDQDKTLISLVVRKIQKCQDCGRTLMY